MTGPGIATSGHFGYLIEPGLTEIFWEAYNRVPSVIQELYAMKTSDSAKEYDLGVGSMGEFEEFEGRIQYDSPEQLWRTEYEHVEYAKGFQIKRKFFDDEMYGVMNDRASMLGLSAWRSRETKAASLFNNCKSTVGFDGKVLCANDHPTSPSDSTSMDNLFAEDLTVAGLSTIRRAMMAWTDDRGNLANVMPDLLLVPGDLEETAWKIVQTPSIYEMGSANLTGGFHKKRYRVVTWELLTDTNLWFLIDSGLMKQFLKWYDRIALEFAMTNDFDTLMAKFRAYMRYSFGWSDWRWIAGSEVS